MRCKLVSEAIEENLGYFNADVIPTYVPMQLCLVYLSMRLSRDYTRTMQGLFDMSLNSVPNKQLV